MSCTLACVLLNGVEVSSFWLGRLEAAESVVSSKTVEEALELHGLGGSSSVRPDVGLVAIPGFSKVGCEA